MTTMTSHADLATALIKTAELIELRGDHYDSTSLREAAAALAPKPRRTAPAFVMPVIDTGDAALDAWMRRQYENGTRPYVAAPIKPYPPLKPRKWTRADFRAVEAFNEMAVKLWRARGHEVIITGGKIDPNAANVRVLPLL